MHLQIDKKNKLITYILLLLLLSTFNNLSLTNSQFLNLNIKNINVSGLTDEENKKFSIKFNNLILPNIFFIKENYLTDILKKNNLIHSFKIKKIYPKSLNIEINKSSNHIIIVLDDDGPGIPKNEYENVFKPFYKIDKSRGNSKSSVGLGLSITSDVIRSHGGNVTLDKSPLNGLRVRILLPF